MLFLGNLTTVSLDSYKATKRRLQKKNEQTVQYIFEFYFLAVIFRDVSRNLHFLRKIFSFNEENVGRMSVLIIKDVADLFRMEENN